jgi:hypothetical protein
VDIDTLRLEGAFYFHGTRALDPGNFAARGLLPLGQFVDEIWAMLYQLVRAECSEGEWAAFRRAVESGAGGHDGWLYRLKTSDALHHGPHALLVRAVLLEPESTGSHDYLACPEIVQDIARCYKTAYGVDLEALFRSRAVGCIVKFRSGILLPQAVRAACWYLFTAVREQELSSHSAWGFDAQGVAIPPGSVVQVELVNEATTRGGVL